MFEKEAEKRARALERCQTLGVYDDDESYARDLGWNEGAIAGYEEGFKDGAEFAYNKANEQLTLPKDILSLWEQQEQKTMFNQWLCLNGGEEGSLYMTFSDEELEQIFLTAIEVYEKNKR